MTRIRLCRREEIDLAAVVLAGSLHDDPAYRRIFPDDETRAHSLQSFLRGPVAEATRRGTCWVATDPDIVGAAVWVEPGGYPWSWSKQARMVGSLLGVLVKSPSSVLDLVRLGSKVDAHFPDEPVWYLQVLGVSSARQGEGIGHRLVAEVTGRAMADAVPCYLETINERAKAFYERHGFVAVSRDQLLPDGPEHWIMRLDPESAD